MQPTLPPDPSQALVEIVRLTRSVLDAANAEAQAIALNDGLAFTALQEEKEALIDRYVAAGEAFRDRSEEFRGASPALLGQLQTLQEELGAVTRANNATLGPVVERAKSRTRVEGDAR